MAQQSFSRPQAITEAESRWNELHAPADDEISLFDLWLVLRKRWLAMLVIAGVIIALGVAYAFLTPQSFRYGAALEIGQVPQGTGVVPIESTDTVMTRLNQVLLPSQERALQQQAGDETLDLDAQVEVSGAVVTLSGEGTEARGDAYSAYLGGAMERLVAIHDERLASIREGIVSSLEAVREQLAGFQDASSQPGAWEAASGLRLRAAELESQLAALQPSRIISEPRRSEEPTGPGRAVIIALALVLGGMVAVFGAFVIEFVSRANAYARMHQ